MTLSKRRVFVAGTLVVAALGATTIGVVAAGAVGSQVGPHGEPAGVAPVKGPSWVNTAGSANGSGTIDETKLPAAVPLYGPNGKVIGTINPHVSVPPPPPGQHYGPNGAVISGTPFP